MSPYGLALGKYFSFTTKELKQYIITKLKIYATWLKIYPYAQVLLCY